MVKVSDTATMDTIKLQYIPGENPFAITPTPDLQCTKRYLFHLILRLLDHHNVVLFT